MQQIVSPDIFIDMSAICSLCLFFFLMWLINNTANDFFRLTITGPSIFDSLLPMIVANFVLVPFCLAPR